MYLYICRIRGHYEDLNSLSILDDPEGQGFAPSLYVNLTNRCTNACTFCLRATKRGATSDLWIDREPSAQEIIASLKQFDLSPLKEVVFCGFGEPTMRLDTLLEIARYIRTTYPSLGVRLNTNGLANAYWKRDVTGDLARVLTSISISLNSSNPQTYLEITKSSIGRPAHREVLAFARACRDRGLPVTMSVVDCIDQTDQEACAALCKAQGWTFRARHYDRG
ncbi:MAG: TatD family nuclease-associated radical SAM protein [Eggerthellaceae bacterium]|jgi:TatD family-associated radical SAM protein|nr:TatD family nuclease-associated radical SAM protein [Eggerthellaceae bacterium]